MLDPTEAPDTAPASAPAPQPEPLPAGGGTYLRLPDGSLQRVGGTEPAGDLDPEA
jgi:hypothetical protein